MGDAGWLGPQHDWPAHSRPEAQRALKRARDAGFYLKKGKSTAKGWGVITCSDPDVHPPDARCTTFISSTSGPADGSATGKVIDSLRTKCAHERTGVGTTHDPDASSDASSDLDEARVLIERAEQAIGAAEHLREHGGHRDLVEDYLTQADASVADAERLLDLAVSEEDAAEKSMASASAAAREAGASVSLGSEGLAERAEQQVGEAEIILFDRAGALAQKLRARCATVRAAARGFLV